MISYLAILYNLRLATDRAGGPPQEGEVEAEASRRRARDGQAQRLYPSLDPSLDQGASKEPCPMIDVSHTYCTISDLGSPPINADRSKVDLKSKGRSGEGLHTSIARRTGSFCEAPQGV